METVVYTFIGSFIDCEKRVDILSYTIDSILLNDTKYNKIFLSLSFLDRELENYFDIVIPKKFPSIEIFKHEKRLPRILHVFWLYKKILERGDKYDYIFLVDDDDLISKNSVMMLKSYLDIHQNISCVRGCDISNHFEYDETSSLFDECLVKHQLSNEDKMSIGEPRGKMFRKSIISCESLSNRLIIDNINVFMKNTIDLLFNIAFLSNYKDIDEITYFYRKWSSPKSWSTSNYTTEDEIYINQIYKYITNQ